MGVFRYWDEVTASSVHEEDTIVNQDNGESKHNALNSLHDDILQSDFLEVVPPFGGILKGLHKFIADPFYQERA